MKGIWSVVLGAVFLVGALAPSTQSTPSSQLSSAPVTLLEALDKNGRPAPNVAVTVRAVTSGGDVVYQGPTDKEGKVYFTSSVPKEILEAAGSVVDMVYEVTFVAPNELCSTFFSVQHLKQPETVTAQEKEILERERTKHIQARLKADAAALAGLDPFDPKSAAPVSDRKGNGTYAVPEITRCTIEHR